MGLSDIVNGVLGMPRAAVNMYNHPKFWNTQDLDWGYSGYLLAACVVGLITVVFYANSIGSDVTKRTDNFGIATSSSQAQSDSAADRPPIPPPTEITSLRVYPIKSCRGIEINATRLKKSGLMLDRNWMFVDMATKKFLTIRSDPSMTLIDTAISEGEGEHKGQQMLDISINKNNNTNNNTTTTNTTSNKQVVSIPAFPSPAWLAAHTHLETVNIWDRDTDGHVYSPEINAIFCAFFAKDVALVYKGPTPRMVAINGTDELYGKATPHHFADVMSLQIASEASLKDLNRRLALQAAAGEAAAGADSPRGGEALQQLTIERFRPNIIVRGRDDHPWEEDTWKRVRLSTAIPAEEALYKIDLDVVARCARCQVPNVDPATAEKDAREPWETLMQFRRVDEGGAAKYKPCFGMMGIAKNEGKVAVGGVLEVLETTDKHLYSLRAFKDL
jgi:uncharacterized protein YcbX